MIRHFVFPEASRDSINTGLIGAGISASRSPLMHMREAEAQGLTLDYRLFDLETVAGGSSILPGLLTQIETAGYTGVNITHPCKQRVMDYLDELSVEASDLGAVNTVLFRDGRRIGHNTDWSGFHHACLSQLTGVDTGCILQLGAGGAGSAVAYALARAGVKTLILSDIAPDKVSELIQRLSVRFPKVDFRISSNIPTEASLAAGIVNTTPVGMKNYPGLPLPAEYLQSRHWVADVIYFPLETELLRLARERGCRTMDGSGMAIYQAVKAFELFTGKPADARRMSRTFHTEFGQDPR